MKTKLSTILILNFLIIFSLIAGVNKVFAQDQVASENIQYPVEELDNCESQADCKIYCDKPENIGVCLDFAEENNLMSPEEIEMAKNFLAAGGKGPGDCNTKETCEEYCNDTNHIDECISFAEKNNLLPPLELEEAKKVQSAIARGIKPPPCGNKKTCDAYCEESEHMEECITFGEAAGFIQGKELEDAKKMLQALKRGVKPPPCKGKEACDEYCSSPDNMEVCMNFAIEAGFMSEQEKADSEKMLQAIKKGFKPPNCKGKEECDIYCFEEDHFEECTNFAEAAGFMTSEEAAMARKTKGKGPGGCKSKDECESFCNNPDNQETCFNFAKENGMIPEEDLRRMEEGRQQFQQSLQQAPPAVMDCLQSGVGLEMIEKMKNGSIMPSREIGEKMQECFEQMGPPEGPGGPGEGGFVPPTDQTGPGGCQTAEECKSYCESHIQECSNFQSTMGQEGGDMPTGNFSPGGCASPEECQNYCGSHPEECQSPQQPFVSPEMPSPPINEEYFPPAPLECTDPMGCMQEPNQMMVPNVCEGENCQYAPPPNQSSEQQTPGEQLPGQQPPSGEIMPLIPSQMPAPSEQLQPPLLPAPPATESPPAETPPSLPSSFLDLNLLLGSIIQGFVKLLPR